MISVSCRMLNEDKNGNGEVCVVLGVHKLNVLNTVEFFIAKIGLFHDWILNSGLVLSFTV